MFFLMHVSEKKHCAPPPKEVEWPLQPEGGLVSRAKIEARAWCVSAIDLIASRSDPSIVID